MYKVKYESNTGADDCIMEYNTIEEAEAAIEEDLENFKEYAEFIGYDYGKFGSKTEIWALGSNEYASWERLWENR